MTIPFLKAHGAKNDFLLTMVPDLPPGVPLAELARTICDRHTGVGADGWLHVSAPAPDAEAEIRLFNADGSLAEISGNDLVVSLGSHAQDLGLPVISRT